MQTSTMSKILLTVLLLVPMGLSLWWFGYGTPALRLLGAAILVGGIFALWWLWWPRGEKK